MAEWYGRHLNAPFKEQKMANNGWYLTISSKSYKMWHWQIPFLFQVVDARAGPGTKSILKIKSRSNQNKEQQAERPRPKKKHKHKKIARPNKAPQSPGGLSDDVLGKIKLVMNDRLPFDLNLLSFAMYRWHGVLYLHPIDDYDDGTGDKSESPIILPSDVIYSGMFLAFISRAPVKWGVTPYK